MYYVNGHYVQQEEARISVSDLGVVRGFGVFDFLRTYRGKPFHLWDHLLRLQASAKEIGLLLPNTLEEIENIVHSLFQKSGLLEAGIKIVVTGGLSSDQLMPEQKSTLIVIASPLSPLPKHYYTNGLKAITTTLLRPFPSAKTTHYIPAILALQKAKACGAEEAIYINQKREILEATTSNFFMFKNGVLITPPPAEILVGITRNLVLKLAKNRFPIEERAISYEELKECDEAFLTSSNKEIVPLSRIDNFTFSIGEKGATLQALFEEYTQSYLLDIAL